MKRFELIYGQAWWMRREAWQEQHLRFMKEIAGKGAAALASEPAAAMPKRPVTDCYGDEFPKMEMVGKLAIVPVSGPMVKGATGSDKYCMGCMAHEDVHADIDAALAAGAKTFLFNFATPGGTVMGTPELAQRVAELSKAGKGVYGFTEQLCCSAGYYVAAGCQGLFCTPSAVVGSIGTMWEAMNFAGMLEQLGIGWDVFTSGPLKGTGHPARELSPEQRDYMQATVDKMSKEFKGHVTQFRKAVGPDTMQGQVFTGREAVANGLFDANASGLAEVISFLR
jgi:protease-4